MVGNGVCVGVGVRVEVGSGVFSGVMVAVSACAAAVNACAIAVLISGLYWLSAVGVVESTCPQAERMNVNNKKDMNKFLFFIGICILPVINPLPQYSQGFRTVSACKYPTLSSDMRLTKSALFSGDMFLKYLLCLLR